MCMPLFRRLRALSLKHFCSPPPPPPLCLTLCPYWWWKGDWGDGVSEVHHFSVVVSNRIEDKKFWSPCRLSPCNLRSNTTAQAREQRARVQSMCRHHGTNARSYAEPNYSDRVQTKHIPALCACARALLTKRSRRCLNGPLVPLRWLWYFIFTMYEFVCACRKRDTHSYIGYIQHLC